MKKSDTYKTIFLSSMILIFAGLTLSTDLTNIESIFPQGDSVSIEGDLAMNGNSILSFFDSSCSSGEVVVGVNDDGSYDCVDVSDEVSGDYVDRDGDSMTGTLDMSGENLEDVDELRSSDLVLNRRLDSNSDDVDRWFWLLGEWGSSRLNVGGNIFGERSSGHDDIRLIDFGFSSSSNGPEDRYKAYMNYNVGGRGGPFDWGMARVDYDGTEYLALYYEGNRFWDSGTYFTGQLMDTPGVNQDEVFTNVLTSDDVEWNGEISYEGVDRVLKQDTLELRESDLDVDGDTRFRDDVDMEGNQVDNLGGFNTDGSQNFYRSGEQFMRFSGHNSIQFYEELRSHDDLDMRGNDITDIRDWNIERNAPRPMMTNTDSSSNNILQYGGEGGDWSIGTTTHGNSDFVISPTHEPTSRSGLHDPAVFRIDGNDIEIPQGNLDMQGNDIEDVSRMNVEDGFQVPVGEDAW